MYLILLLIMLHLVEALVPSSRTVGVLLGGMGRPQTVGLIQRLLPILFAPLY